MADSIRAAADALAESRREAKDKDEKVAAAQVTFDAVNDRILALEAERAAIGAKRQAGGGDDARDGARLQVIALDLSALEGLLAGPTADLAGARAVAQAAWIQVSHFERQLSFVKDEAALTDRIEYANKLEVLYQHLLPEIAILEKRVGRSRQSWTPSREFASAINRLNLMRVDQ